MQLKSKPVSVGGIAQWQSIRLQIERSPVQLRLPPNIFPVYSNMVNYMYNRTFVGVCFNNNYIYSYI